MIKATFTRQKSSILESVVLTGHAGSGEYGFDVVCAAVSALSISLVNSLEILANCQADLEIDDIDGGYMKIDISHVAHNTDEKAQLLFESFLLAMTNLAENSVEFVSTEVIIN
ncbi:ribosomal-processing cysteine protease Prp [Streptococcus caballi]|uniref:ribosomal-processing cysteine protease Prp n=1 Tax=Streptococcus caballi TaxID=439220 RepID=UPI00035F53C9|nr:ribosomal-processing cysteine protease Prp [Streptococcus caballi]